MTFRGPVDTVLSIGGRNLTGMGMLMAIAEQPLAHRTEEVNLIGKPYIFAAKTGKKAYGFAVGGYVRDDAGSVLSLSNADETAREPHSAIYARFGDNPGAHADILPAVIARGGTVDLPRDGLQKVTGLTYELADDHVLLDSTLIAHRAGVAASAAPYSNLRHDFGAAHTTGFTVAFHIDNVVWDGATRLQLDLFTHSAASPGSTGWTRVTALNAHRFLPADGTHFDAVAARTANLSRWVGVSAAFTSGGSDSAADIIAAIYRA